MLRAIVLGVLLGGGSVAGAQTAQELKGSVAPATVAKVEDKKLPAEVSIPEPRVDKTKILTLELRVLNVDMQALETKYKELKAQQDDKQAKLFAEFSSALKAAGVPEDSLNRYEVNLETLKMKLKAEEPVKK